MLKRSGTYVTQSGDGTHGEQHVAWFVQQPGPNKVAVDPYSGDEGQSDDPLQSNGLQDLSGNPVTQERVGESRVESSSEGHGDTTGKLVGAGLGRTTSRVGGHCEKCV